MNNAHYIFSLIYVYVGIKFYMTDGCESGMRIWIWADIILYLTRIVTAQIQVYLRNRQWESVEQEI